MTGARCFQVVATFAILAASVMAGAYAQNDANLMIVDVDCGSDDAIALMMALSARAHWNILAITTVTGNIGVNKATGNVLRVLNVCKKFNIPVFPGAHHGILEFYPKYNEFFGPDGLGGAAHNFSTGTLHAQSENAAVKLVELAKKYKNKITLVTLGPLTNVGLAQSLDPDFLANIKTLYIMGGNLGECGNEVEFNFMVDPIAANITLSGECKDVTVFTYQTGMDQENAWPWAWYYEWLEDSKNPKTVFIREIYASSVTYMKDRNFQKFVTFDPWTMACVLNPNVVKEFETRNVTVDLCHTPGLLLTPKIGGRRVKFVKKLYPDRVFNLSKEMLLN